MPKSRLTAEIIRLAKSRGYICLDNPENGSLEVWRGDTRLLSVMPERDYEIRYGREIRDSDQLLTMAEGFIDAVSEAREYVAAVEKAPPLIADGLRDGFGLIAEHNHIVLAGKDMGNYSFEFVTWEWNHDHSGVGQGHYYHNYSAAKEDFAFRSGLVPRCKQYTQEQATAVYRIVAAALDRGTLHSTDEYRLLKDCRRKLERAYPTLAERIAVIIVELERPAQVRLIRNSLYAVQDIVGESLAVPYGTDELKYYCGEPNEESDISRYLPDFEVTGPLVIAAYDKDKGELKSLTPDQIDEQIAIVDAPECLPKAIVIVCDPNADPRLMKIKPTQEGIQGLLSGVFGAGDFGCIGSGRIKAFFPADVDTKDLITDAHVRKMPDGVVAAVGRIVVAAVDEKSGSVYSMTWDERYDCMKSLQTPVTLTPEQIRKELESFHVIEPPAQESGPSMESM